MTEAEQIAELKKELQQQQEQINALKANGSGFIKNWERYLIYPLIVLSFTWELLRLMYFFGF